MRSRELRELINELTSTGWRWRRGSKHHVFSHDKYGVMVVSASPSDINAFRQIRRMLDKKARQYDSVD